MTCSCTIDNNGFLLLCDDGRGLSRISERKHVVAAVDRLRAEDAHVPTDEDIHISYVQWRRTLPLQGYRNAPDTKDGWFAAVKWAFAQRLPAAPPALGSCDEEFYKWRYAWMGKPDDLRTCWETCWNLFNPKPPEPVDPFEKWWAHTLTDTAPNGTVKELVRKAWDAASEAQP